MISNINPSQGVHMVVLHAFHLRNTCWVGWATPSSGMMTDNTSWWWNIEISYWFRFASTLKMKPFQTNENIFWTYPFSSWNIVWGPFFFLGPATRWSWCNKLDTSFQIVLTRIKSNTTASITQINTCILSCWKTTKGILRYFLSLWVSYLI